MNKSTSAPESNKSVDARLAGINRLIAGNQFKEAIREAEQVSTIDSARIPARALLALACAMSGDRDKAIGILKEFVDPGSFNKSELLLAIGSAWFKLGEIAEAIRFLAAAARLDNNHPLVQARLGACLLAGGRTADAQPHLERAVELMPKSGGAWLNLARAHLEQGRAEQALAALEHAAPLPDKEADKYNMACAEALARLERHGEAEAVLRQAAETGIEGSIEALVNLMSSRGKHDEAWRELREALEKTPDDSSLLELAAELAQVRGRFGEADRYLDRALKKDPDNAALWTRRAMMASRRLGEKQGREAADKALDLTREKQGPPRAQALAAHAHVLIEEEKHKDAEAAYREALATFPNCIPALSGLGNLLMQLGRVDEATQTFEQLKKIAPLQGWSQLIHAREVPDDPAVLEQMAKAARRPSLEGPVQTHMLFTLAAAWEKKKDYKQAWAYASEANNATKERLGYRPEVHRLRVEREMARFSKAFMKSRKAWGDQSHLPVFVLGMPRSGTTLVEQILGSHTGVFGAGELSLVPELIQKLDAWERKTGSRREYPECVDDMTQAESLRFAEKHLQELQAYAPQAGRIVDKLPHNFEHIGLIKLIFPNAKILHMKREPRDVAMSNYFTDYAAKFGGMGFAYDLNWIGEQLVDHQRLMKHWHSVFPDQLLEVDYDALVEDVDGWAKKIIAYLDLPWEEGVLSFQKLERAVKTASVWQVRQPVYKTSKAKWKNYKKADLAPLEAALAEVPPKPAPLPLPKVEPGLFPGAMAHLEAGRPAEAEQALRTLLLARSSHAAAHHFLGAALYQQGKLEEARKEMRRSLELLGGHAPWRENLAKVEDALGNADEAKNLRQQRPERSKAKEST